MKFFSIVPHWRTSSAKKKALILLVATFLMFVCVFQMLKEVEKRNTVARFEDTQTNRTFEISAKTCQKNKIKTILIWNNFYGTGRGTLRKGRESFIASRCPVTNCAVWDRMDPDGDLPVEEYDAVLFHGIETSGAKRDDLPLRRHSHQRYIFRLIEPPGIRPRIYNRGHFFNWTMTYRRDSDIVEPYVRFRHVLDPPGIRKYISKWMEPNFRNMPVLPWIENKTKLVAGMISNPNSQSRRHKYIELLRRYIDVDIYGREGRKCDNDDCNAMLKNDYKFHLSFENSLCDDYVTEKFDRAYHHNIVPIVYGGSDYDIYAPPMSFIDIKDFYSPQDLARYLYYLDANPKEYEKYFWWQKFYTPSKHAEDDAMCVLCGMLNDSQLPVQSYANISSWWFYEDVCHHPETHFERAHTPPDVKSQFASCRLRHPSAVFID